MDRLASAHKYYTIIAGMAVLHNMRSMHELYMYSPEVTFASTQDDTA